MVDKVLGWAPDTRLAILAPLARSRKGSFEEECASLQAQGFVRLRVNGEMVSIDTLGPLKKTGKHDFDVVVDRLRVKPESQQRLAESFETALNLAEGRVIRSEEHTSEPQSLMRIPYDALC